MNRSILFALVLILALLLGCNPQAPITPSPTQEASTAASETPVPTPTAPPPSSSPTTSNLTPPPQSASPTASVQPAPAKFQVTSIDIAPIVVSLGEKIAVTANVGNIGGTRGSYSLTLKVNGAIQETKDLTIGPGSTQTTVFNVVKDVPGLYTVEIEGFTEIVRVKETGAFPRLVNFYVGSNAFFSSKLRELDSSQVKSYEKSLARWDLVMVDFSVATIDLSTDL